MPVFISYSFQNQPEFDNLKDFLDGVSVPYWNPEDIKPGASLRDQLRAAIEQCSGCIFIATHHSTSSSWCGSELGAFWGAGKPIVVYLADSSLTEEALPPIVQPDVWERRLGRVASRAQEIEQEHSRSSNGSRAETVGNMTVEEFDKLVAGSVALALAEAKSKPESSSPETLGKAARSASGPVLQGIRASKRRKDEDDWQRHVLWVDDRPDNNILERQAFEAMGLHFTLAISTREALERLRKERFAAVISDMGRREGASEGYVLLQELRKTDSETPYFIYAGSNAPKHRAAAKRHGAQGSTNHPQELFEMVLQALALQETGYASPG